MPLLFLLLVYLYLLILYLIPSNGHYPLLLVYLNINSFLRTKECTNTLTASSLLTFFFSVSPELSQFSHLYIPLCLLLTVSTQITLTTLCSSEICLQFGLAIFPSSIINSQQSTLLDFFTDQTYNPYIVSLFQFASVCTKTWKGLLYVRKGNKR